MFYSLNSLKGAYKGDSIGDYYRGYEGDTTSLDSRSHILNPKSLNPKPLTPKNPKPLNPKRLDYSSNGTAFAPHSLEAFR